MFVTLIEPISNQAFVFASNKLREAVGASNLIYCVGEKAREFAGNSERVLTTSGKAILLTDNLEQGKDIVRKVNCAGRCKQLPDWKYAVAWKRFTAKTSAPPSSVFTKNMRGWPPRFPARSNVSSDSPLLSSAPPAGCRRRAWGTSAATILDLNPQCPWPRERWPRPAGIGCAATFMACAGAARERPRRTQPRLACGHPH